MTIRKHILNYLYQVKESIGDKTFRTSDIQDLSFEGLQRFGKRLGSSSSYEREFRNMRQNSIIKVKEAARLPRQRQASWILTDII